MLLPRPVYPEARNPRIPLQLIQQPLVLLQSALRGLQVGDIHYGAEDTLQIPLIVQLQLAPVAKMAETGVGHDQHVHEIELRVAVGHCPPCLRESIAFPWEPELHVVLALQPHLEWVETAQSVSLLGPAGSSIHKVDMIPSDMGGPLCLAQQALRVTELPLHLLALRYITDYQKDRGTARKVDGRA